MKPMTLISALLFMIVAVPHIAPAEGVMFTASGLMRTCSGKLDTTRNACYFYIMGVAEGASSQAKLAKDKAPFCIPAATKGEHLVSLVQQNLATNLSAYPEDKEMPAGLFVVTLLKTAYPCSK